MSKRDSAPANSASITNTNVTEIDRLPGSETLYFLPEEIEIDDIADRIPLSAEDEANATMELADSIRLVGQEQPCKVYQTKDGAYRLFIGRRRRNAIAAINAGMENGEEPLKVWCVLDRTPGDSYQKAVIENIHRKNYSAIEFAQIIAKTKQSKGWTGKDWSIKAADYFKVSRATVTEAVKLLDLPEDIRAKVHTGDYTAQSAFALVKDIKESKRAEVAKEAEKEAKKEHAQKVQRQAENPRRSTKEKEETKKRKPVVKKKHIEKAARNVEGATDTPKPPSRASIIDFFAGQDGIAFGYPDGDVRTFIRKFCLWAKTGQGSERTLDRLFSDMVAGAKPGTKPKEPKEPKDQTAKTTAKPKPVVSGKKRLKARAA